MKPIYRADHVGSLLRSKELKAAINNSALSAEQRSEIEDRHIIAALQRQQDLGFKIFSDGELRRRGFMTDFYDSVEGLNMERTIERTWQGGAPTARLYGVVGAKVRQKRRLAKHEVDFLRKHSPGDIKMTLPTPNQFPAIAYKKGISDAVYPKYFDFLWDIVPIFRAEIEALVNEGVRYIQVDAPRYSYYVDPKWRRYIEDEIGVAPDAALDEAIRVDNACIENVRNADVVLAIHLCRGNNQSQWYAEGGYDPIAEKLFNQLNVDTFLLEYESERAGSFEPLRYVPRDKTVVLGLVSSKVAQLEKQQELLQRIEEASRYVPLENLALSPQCGFASTMDGNLLSEDDQWKKLELVADTARMIWGTT
jgi:5-methyltetrahydropteroyltriglutamate--homocysteine methyltransferase